MKRSLPILIIIVLALILVGAWRYLSVQPVQETPENVGAHVDYLTLPAGFKAEVFWEGNGSTLSTPGVNAGPRLMAFSDDTVFVSLTKQGIVMALEDKNKDGKVEKEKVVIRDLNNPHGLAFNDGWLYIAEEDKVIRGVIAKNANETGNNVNTVAFEKIIDLPKGGHFTRTVKIIDGKLLISIGSNCNVCIEEDVKRATIQQCDLNGKNCTLFARGLRNTVDFVEYQGKIYGTDNGRDNLGNAIPPDEINVIEGAKNYGWPICYGQNIHDTEFDKNTYIRNPCMEPFETPALIDLPAHVAPLGLEFYRGSAFPAEYQGKLFIAYHGSWNADPPVGYKVVMADIETRQLTDFIAGFRTEDGDVLGRPVGIMNFREGFLVSDDTGGKIYRVYYEP